MRIGLQIFIDDIMIKQQNNKMYKSKTPPSKNYNNLTYVEGIQKYKTIIKPLINEQDRKSLQAKLKVEKQSTAAASQRLLNNNYYLRYNKNPFTSINNIKAQQKKKKLSYSSNKLDVPKPRKQAMMTPKSENIVEQLNKLKSSQLKYSDQKRINNFQKANTYLTQLEKTSNYIMSNFNKKKKQSEVKQPKQQEKEQIMIKQSYGLSQQEKIELKRTEIQQIVNMMDQNYFFNEGRKKINIFKCIEDDSYNMSPYQQLEQYKFQFNIMTQKLNKFSVQIPISRDISRLSRQLIYNNKIENVKQVLDQMNNQQIQLRETQLVFQNIMSLASGRLNADILAQINNAYTGNHGLNRQGSDTSSEDSNDIQVLQINNTVNYGFSHTTDLEDKNEITEFQHVHLSQIQQSHKKKCEKLKERIKKLLEQKESALSNRVGDRNWHMNHQEKIENTFKTYVYDNNYGKLNDIQKQVRKNKHSKDRTDTFTLIKLNDTLKYKNTIDSHINKRGFQTSR